MKNRIISVLLPLVAYGISLFLLYLQLPFEEVENLPPQGQLLLTDFMKSPPAVWAVIQFSLIVLVLQLAPVWLILAAHKRDPRIQQYSTIRAFALGITYVLLWHIVITIINAQVVPRSNWALVVLYNSNTYLNFALIVGACVFLLPLIAKFLWHQVGIRRLTIFAGIVGAIVLFNTGSGTAQATRYTDKPNIILIGVDSFSFPQYQIYKEWLPNIRKLQEQSVMFSDTLTPLARTFPAWTSILSGRYPRETGARDNLFPLDQIDSSDFLTRRLKAAGYTTLFSMDERQFSNIGESWGFDKVIGPEIGAADFMLSTMADIPAVNIMVTTWPSFSGALFPYVTYNRAAWKQYYPERFSGMLSDELSEINAAPIFLATHFCMAHSPYKWSPLETPAPPREFDTAGNESHFNAITAADKQVGRLLETLRRTGRLENAVVILLSDHGEGLGYWTRHFKADSYVPPPGVSPHRLQHLEFIFGHGSNLNEPDMNQTLLMISRYIDGKPTNPSSIQTTPAALVDILPTVLELSDLKYDPSEISGISLASALNKPDPKLATRLRFLESGISPPALNSKDPDRKALLQGMSDYFEISRAGKVEIKVKDYEHVIETKRRAVILGKWQLTIYPNEDVLGYQVLLFDRETGRWTDSPDSPLWQEANADRLAESMVHLFGAKEMPEGAWRDYLSKSLGLPSPITSASLEPRSTPAPRL